MVVGMVVLQRLAVVVEVAAVLVEVLHIMLVPLEMETRLVNLLPVATAHPLWHIKGLMVVDITVLAMQVAAVEVQVL
jgi:hypothetical protein